MMKEENVEDYGLSPDEFAEEEALGMLPPKKKSKPKERDAEIQTRNVESKLPTLEVKKRPPVITRDLKEQRW